MSLAKKVVEKVQEHNEELKKITSSSELGSCLLQDVEQNMQEGDLVEDIDEVCRKLFEDAYNKDAKKFCNSIEWASISYLKELI